MEEKIIPAYALDIINANHRSMLNRLWVLVFILVFLLVGTNAGWIIYESQMQDVVVTENTQDGNGVNLIGGGDINYGTETDNNKNENQEREGN